MDTSELRAAIIATHKQRLREALAALYAVEGFLSNGQLPTSSSRKTIESCITDEWKTVRQIAIEAGVTNARSVYAAMSKKLKGKVESRRAENAGHKSIKEFRRITD